MKSVIKLICSYYKVDIMYAKDFTSCFNLSYAIYTYIFLSFLIKSIKKQSFEYFFVRFPTKYRFQLHTLIFLKVGQSYDLHISYIIKCA